MEPTARASSEHEHISGYLQLPRGWERISADGDGGPIDDDIMGCSAIQRKEYPMTLDQSKMGRVVAEQMEALEERFGDDCQIGDVCTIVEVIGPHGSSVSVRSSEARPHTTIGLLRMAEAMMLASIGGREFGEGE